MIAADLSRLAAELDGPPSEELTDALRELNGAIARWYRTRGVRG